jgi:hypothetical protein
MRMELFRRKSGTRSFTRLDYMKEFREISSATASRDLAEAVRGGILEMRGDKRTAVYRYKG